MGASNFQLLWTMIKNRKVRALNQEMIGYSLETSVGPITRDEAVLFAKATNDTNPLYEADPDLVPPMFLARVVHPMLTDLLIHPKLKLNLMRMVHGEQLFHWHGTARVGDTIRAKLTVKGIREVPIGQVLELLFEAFRGDELLGYGETGLVVRGSSKKGGKKADEAPVLPEPLFETEIPTETNQALRYAEASGDHNFIHTNNLLAKLAGLPRTILHGMCVMSMTTNTLAMKLAEGDINRLGEIGLRFAFPAIPGDKLSLLIYPQEGESGRYPFVLKNAKGKEVLKNGHVIIRQA